MEPISMQPRPEIEADKPPPTLQDLGDLFLRPREFFSGRLALGRMVQLALVLWCCGTAETIEHVEEVLGAGQDAAELLGYSDFISMPWEKFWAFALALGALSAFAFWWLSGWWYVARLRWSGVADPDARKARVVMSYSELVQAAPKVLVALAYTFSFPSFADAFQTKPSYSLILLVFPFWSCLVSYLGVRTTFQTVPSRAQFWFLILPCLAYLLVVIGGIA